MRKELISISMQFEITFMIHHNRLNMKQTILTPFIVVLGSFFLSFTPDKKLREDGGRDFFTIKKGIESLEWGARDDKKVYLYTLIIFFHNANAF